MSKVQYFAKLTEETDENALGHFGRATPEEAIEMIQRNAQKDIEYLLKVTVEKVLVPSEDA